MKIKTKFDVDDKVWIVERTYADAKYHAKSSTIWMLKINVYKKGKTEIGYELPYYYGRCFSDKELFATEDEAEFECIRLNDILDREKRGE